MLALIFNLNHANSAPLSLEDYLRQVETQDPGTRAAQLNESAQKLKLDEGDLQTTIRVEGQASHMDDRRPTLMPSFMGTRTTNSSYSLGLSQQASFGVRWKLSGNLSKTKIYDASLPPGIEASYQDIYPSLELEIPLWRNLFGSETRAAVEQVKSAQKANSIQADIQKINRRNEAELTYWQVANTQEKIRLLKENIERAQRIAGWNNNRVKNNLADRSDLYQAQAVVKLQELNLSSGELDLENQKRKFNQLRGADLNAPVEDLVFKEVSDTQLQSLIAKTKKKHRMDIEAVKYQLIAAEHNTRLGRERVRPNLALFGTSSLVGRDTEVSKAYDEAMDGTHPYSVVGVRFSAALDIGSIHDVVKGYRMEQQSLELQLAQMRKDSEREWSNYQNQIGTVTNQLRMVRNLEGIQKQKTDNERNRLRTGRTVTYQVLMFEQDYANTQAQRLALEMQARQLITQLNLFVEESL